MSFFSTQPKAALRDVGCPARSSARSSRCAISRKCSRRPPGRSYVLRRITRRHSAGRIRLDHGPVGRRQVDAARHPRHARQRVDAASSTSSATRCTRMSHKQRVALNKEHIGFVFQQYHLIDDLTVAENLDIPLSYRNVKKSEREAIVADTLDRFGMVGKKDLYPRQLSGGQQQLVGVARAVIAKPKLILADEPTGNLHSSQGREIMELFKKLNSEGTTIIQVTHSEENAKFGNRIIELRDGWITGSEGPAQ